MVPIDLSDVAASSRRNAEAILDNAIRVTLGTRHLLIFGEPSFSD